MKTAHEGHADIARLLIKAGVDVNRKNEDGKTALDIARGLNYLEIIKILKKAGGK